MMLKAFGTMALLQALEQRGRLSLEMFFESRRCLWRSGASGVFPALDEICKTSRSVQWALTLETMAMLRDPVLWRRQSYLRSVVLWLDVLEVLAVEAPAELWRWTARVLSAIRADDRVEARNPDVLVLLADRMDRSPAFQRSLRSAIDQARRRVGY